MSSDTAAPLSFVCPGQGAEEPGMGIALAARSRGARSLLALASEVTGIDVPRALERGGRALERTDMLQPVLVAVSLGAARALAERGTSPAVCVGHSLGELTALALAANLPDQVALALAAARGRLMHEAALATPGGMLALRSSSPLDLDRAVSVALAEGCVLAADNAPDERVVSGPDDRIRAAARALGPIATRLRTVGAWHSPAMQPAADAFRTLAREALAGRALVTKFVSAARASELSEPDALADALADGLVAPVRFSDALALVLWLGVRRAAVLPPAKSTRSLVRRATGGALEVVDRLEESEG